MLPHWTESDLTANGLQFHYYRTGHSEKPAIVLFHGFSDNGLCWSRVASDLEADYDVIMPDARGHGKSARVQPGEEIDGAADAAGIIDGLNLQKPVVMGHSMGGLTVTRLAAHYPDLISGAILEDPAWIEPNMEAAPPRDNPHFQWLLHADELSLEEVIAKGKAENPAWSDVEFPAWAAAKQQLDKNIFGRANYQYPWRESVKAIHIPTLLIKPEGGAFYIVTDEIAQEAVSLSPSIRVASIPGTGHNIRRENYPAFIKAVKTFLEDSK